MQTTCLIVDDSAVIRAMVARAVKLSGTGVSWILEAANGQDALTILATVKVHLVLSDMHMPEMGGAELIERMQQQPNLRQIPVVIVSAEPSTQRMEELCTHGARGYLQKPFKPEDIRALIVPLLEQQHENN